MWSKYWCSEPCFATISSSIASITSAGAPRSGLSFSFPAGPSILSKCEADFSSALNETLCASLQSGGTTTCNVGTTGQANRDCDDPGIDGSAHFHDIHQAQFRNSGGRDV
eukprot:m.870834 g.870834  ORF g.870834 m.870834 type:complete len:110 (-) comp23567_c0_seq35:1029-1358(-)